MLPSKRNSPRPPARGSNSEKDTPKKLVDDKVKAPSAPKTLKEKRDEKYKRIKQMYNLDLKNDDYILFQMIKGVKKMPHIPGLLFIPRKGYAVGTFKDRASAMKLQGAKKKSMTLAESKSGMYTYNVVKLSTALRDAVVKTGLKI